MKNPNTQLRPVQLTPHIFLAKLLDFLRFAIGGDRFNNLFIALKNSINRVSPESSHLSLLDYGCGMMTISIKLKNDGIIKDFTGLDIYPSSDFEGDDLRWANYIQIKPEGIAAIKEKYNIAIIVDVLHHVTSYEERVSILKGLSHITDFIIVKDHFEYGYFSRQVLRLIDWLGNFAYGVRIPSEYFTKDSWGKLLMDAEVTQVEIQDKVKIHSGLIGYLVPSKYHFISILKNT